MQTPLVFPDPSAARRVTVNPFCEKVHPAPKLVIVGPALYIVALIEQSYDINDAEILGLAASEEGPSELSVSNSEFSDQDAANANHHMMNPSSSKDCHNMSHFNMTLTHRNRSNRRVPAKTNGLSKASAAGELANNSKS